MFFRISLNKTASDKAASIANAEEYLRRAEEAEARAQLVRDQEAKLVYIEAARHWRDLARFRRSADE
jgi:hypothetical protein